MEVVDLYRQPVLRSVMAQISGDSHSLPQLVHNGRYLEGGVDDLQFMHDEDMRSGRHEMQLAAQKTSSWAHQPHAERPVIRDGLDRLMS